MCISTLVKKFGMDVSSSKWRKSVRTWNALFDAAMQIAFDILCVLKNTNKLKLAEEKNKNIKVH